MIIRSKAPLRISFGGGATDVSPYPERKGGAVLNITIDRYAYAIIDPGTDGNITIKSLDQDVSLNFSNIEKIRYDGKLDLVKAAIKIMDIKKGFNLLLHTDAPPGTGLGSSGALATAMVGALAHLMNSPKTTYEIAELAYNIERKELGIKGGRQDQYAASFGGLNFIEFFTDRTIVNPLRLKPEILNELQYRMLLCYTGKSRFGPEIIEDHVRSYVQGDADVTRALDETKSLAIDMKNALLLGKLNQLGSLLHEAWCVKKKFSPKITLPFIDEIYEAARQNGALGGKLLGAGGGGHLLLFCQENNIHEIREKIEMMGGKNVRFAFEFGGLQTWETTNGEVRNGTKS